jgi:DUF4097 and DUF4098 domain-containing protein YvlB
MNRSLCLATLALAVSPLAACSWHYDFHKADREVTRSLLHQPGEAVEVRTYNGSVKVIAAPDQDEVTVEARLRCRGKTAEEAEERLAATTLTVERRADGTLQIEPVFPGGHRSGDGASVNVRIPDADGVSIHTSNGGVTSSGLSGKVVIDTSNGGVRLSDHDGDAWIDTSNGGVVVEHVAGSLILDTSNGSVKLEDVTGPVRADTSNGSLTVTLSPDASGPMHLDTSNGSITARVGQGFAGEVRLSTSNGSIKVDDHSGRVTSQTLTRSSGRVVIGGGGESSVIDTSNGRITLTIEG